MGGPGWQGGQRAGGLQALRLLEVRGGNRGVVVPVAVAMAGGIAPLVQHLLDLAHAVGIHPDRLTRAVRALHGDALIVGLLGPLIAALAAALPVAVAEDEVLLEVETVDEWDGEGAGR